MSIAEMIYERHELLTDCLTKLGVDPNVAAEGCMPYRACYKCRKL